MVPLPRFRFRLDLELLLDPRDIVGDDDSVVSVVMQRYASNIERRIVEQPGWITRI